MAPRDRGGLVTERSPRFRFGANWASFSNALDGERIGVARTSLSARLGDIAGLSFLDAGCGSGLFSLAAVQLGATRVLSFDFDVDSVRTTAAVRQRFAPEAAGQWQVERGDLLDRSFVEALGRWDIVYSWGVLHHTGDMIEGWHNIAGLVASGGRLFVSIYNDQGFFSRVWLRVKRGYHRVPPALRTPYVILVMAPREAISAVLSGPRAYVRGWRQYKINRGMSRWHDLVDWVGGYPFEVAKPEAVCEFFRAHGFHLEWMQTVGGGLGCNQFVFRRVVPVI
jgi:2-polyprenyl-6-hydroxyphenyl methylase/3-demethylubiquinone-9 3-methyltransferase